MKGEAVADDILVVMINVPDQQVALNMAEQLVASKTAACVNCLPGVQSVYRWQDRVEQAFEVTLLVKTTRHRYSDLESLVKQLHPYDVPEIIAFSIAAGLPAYLQWVRDETTEGKSAG